MDYKKLYAEKLVSAEKAASVVKSGDWVDYGWTTGTPVAVDAAIAKRLPELENVNFRGGILMWVPEIFKIENPAAHMTWNSWHMSVSRERQSHRDSASMLRSVIPSFRDTIVSPQPNRM